MFGGESGSDIFRIGGWRILEPSGWAPDQAVFAPVTRMGVQGHETWNDDCICWYLDGLLVDF